MALSRTMRAKNMTPFGINLSYVSRSSVPAFTVRGALRDNWTSSMKKDKFLLYMTTPPKHAAQGIKKKTTSQ